MDESIEERSQVDLELGRGRACAASLKKMIGELPEVRLHDRGPSICRVNQLLRKQDPEAYEPQVVSLGPLHHGKANLTRMEKLKLDILRSILRGLPEDTLDIFFDEVCQCLDDAKQEYSEKIELTDDEVARILVIDGCFFIVLLSWQTNLEICDYKSWDMQLRSSYPHVMTDLFLLENQLPFFVVNRLFKKFCVFFPKLCHDYPRFMDFLLQTMGINFPPTKYPKEEDLRHLLHLRALAYDPRLLPDEPSLRSYWHIVMIPVKKVMHLFSMAFFGALYIILSGDSSGLFGAPKGSTNVKVIRTATELQEAGIKFQPKAWPKEYYTACLSKISFRDGKLEIPPRGFDRSACILLRNQIAFEQSTYFHYSSHVSHYCFLLDNLINTHEDVSILRENGTLENGLGSDSEFAEEVNSLCRGVYTSRADDPYAELRKEVQKFCQSPQNMLRAFFIRMSVLGASALLVCTIIQTYFTVYPRK